MFDNTPDWRYTYVGSVSYFAISSLLLNDDEYPDIIAGTTSDDLFFLLGNGDGSFELSQEYSLSNPL